MRHALATILGFLVAAGPAGASELRYVGRADPTGRAVLQLDSGWFVEAGEGDMLPDGRRLRAVEDEAIVVERSVGEAEKRTLRRAGAAVADRVLTTIEREPSAASELAPWR